MEHFVIQMPIIGAPLSQPGRMLPDDAQRVHHNAALCKEAANWLTRHPDARGGRAPLNVSRVSFPPKKLSFVGWQKDGPALECTCLRAEGAKGAQVELRSPQQASQQCRAQVEMFLAPHGPDQKVFWGAAILQTHPIPQAAKCVWYRVALTPPLLAYLLLPYVMTGFISRYPYIH